jgi:hypothetical protein
LLLVTWHKLRMQIFVYVFSLSFEQILMHLLQPSIRSWLSQQGVWQLVAGINGEGYDLMLCEWHSQGYAFMPHFCHVVFCLPKNETSFSKFPYMFLWNFFLQLHWYICELNPRIAKR